MGTTEILARYIAETTYDTLPADVVRAAKDIMLDGIGVMLAGSQEEPPRLAAEYASEMGGRPDCTVFGHGVSGHVLDYEPMWHPGYPRDLADAAGNPRPRRDTRGLGQGRDHRTGR